MNFEPQKFFIGLMDFFSILLPGALLTYMLMGEIGPIALGARFGKIQNAEAWVVFVAASYLIGHLVFLAGSWLDELYDWIRGYTLNKQIARLAHRGKLLNWFARSIVAVVFKRERNLAVDRAAKIKQKLLESVKGSDAINTFQWSKALLNIESPTSLAVIQRFEADSKFFRCFVIVLIILIIKWCFDIKENWHLVAFGVVLVILALWRYMEQRYKATNQAYWSVITLTAKDGKVVLDKSVNTITNPTHAGGVVFRKRWWGKAKYLLVEAKDDPAQWVLPKGHVEEGEQHGETAVREVHEETGVWARIVHDLGDVSYSVKGTVVTVRFFLMQAVGCGLRSEKDRRHVWLPLDKAIAWASHAETRDLLQLTQAQCKMLQSAEQRRVRT